MNIKIQWLEDYVDCEDCGCSFATGASVTFSDGTELDFSPCAACFDSVSYEETYIYNQILEHLGYTLEHIDPQ